MMRDLKVTAMHSTQRNCGNGRYGLVTPVMNRFTGMIRQLYVNHEAGFTAAIRPRLKESSSRRTVGDLSTGQLVGRYLRPGTVTLLALVPLISHDEKGVPLTWVRCWSAAGG